MNILRSLVLLILTPHVTNGADFKKSFIKSTGVTVLEESHSPLSMCAYSCHTKADCTAFRWASKDSCQLLKLELREMSDSETGSFSELAYVKGMIKH